MQSRQAGHSTAVHPRRVRRHGRRRLRRLSASAKRWRASISGVATSVLATFLGSDPITVGATPEQKKLWLGTHCRRRHAVRLRRHRTGCGQRSGRPEDHRGARDGRRQDRRLQDQRQQAVDQQRRHRRCLHHARQHARRSQLVHRGKGRRASPRTSRRTSTASASATPPLLRSTTSMSMPTG